MQTIDYVVPSDNLRRSIPDFIYLDLVLGMPKLRHIGQRTFVRLSADFNSSERVDLRYLRLARFGYSQGSSSRFCLGRSCKLDLSRPEPKQDKQVDLRQALVRHSKC
jgi:hypothetical protein